eukprot:2321045-Amphidinium_carterae.1
MPRATIPDCSQRHAKLQSIAASSHKLAMSCNVLQWLFLGTELASSRAEACSLHQVQEQRVNRDGHPGVNGMEHVTRCVSHVCSTDEETKVEMAGSRESGHGASRSTCSHCTG